MHLPMIALLKVTTHYSYGNSPDSGPLPIDCWAFHYSNNAVILIIKMGNDTEKTGKLRIASICGKGVKGCGENVGE